MFALFANLSMYHYEDGRVHHIGQAPPVFCGRHAERRPDIPTVDLGKGGADVSRQSDDH